MSKADIIERLHDILDEIEGNDTLFFSLQKALNLDEEELAAILEVEITDIKVFG